MHSRILTPILHSCQKNRDQALNTGRKLGLRVGAGRGSRWAGKCRQLVGRQMSTNTFGG